MYINFKNVKEKTYGFSKTFEAVHIWWEFLAKMQAYNLQIYLTTPCWSSSQALFKDFVLILKHLFKRSINNSLFCAALINIFWFIVEIAVTIILQIFS